jgi:hypothetical protein
MHTRLDRACSGRSLAIVPCAAAPDISLPCRLIRTGELEPSFG